MIHLKINDVIELSIAKMLRNGVPQHEAEISAPIYLEGELWGKRTHGFRYLEGCLFQYQEGATRRQELTIRHETANSALVDGGFHFPFFIHYTAMKLAIDLAKASGLAVVGARNGGVSGLLGYYSQMATEEGLIGIAINSAVSAVVPPGGVTPLLSTNPLTVGIPRLDRPPLILDMATSAGTYSQIMVAQRDKQPLPAGIAVDLDGKPTTDPFKTVDEAHHTHLLPFGGYKGFGLALMIELLCNASLGTPIGKSKLTSYFDPAYCNGLYFVFKPDLFVERDVFDAHVTQLIDDIESSQRATNIRESRLMQATGQTSIAISFLSSAASLLIMRGRLHEAWQCCERAINLGKLEGYPLSLEVGHTSVYQMDILREWNQLDTAGELAQKVVQRDEPLLLSMGLPALARVHLARGEFEAAAEILHHAERVSEHMRNPYWHALNSVGTHVRFWIARGELERAARWAERVQHEQRHVAPLARELEDMALVRVVLAQHKANEALTRLVPLLETATKQERWGHVIELLLLQTLAYLGCQEEQAALTALTQAVHLAEPEGYVRSFVDEGVTMAVLLSKLRDQQRKQGPTPYLDKVLSAFSPQKVVDHRATQNALPQPLSGREQEVLHLLASGASNQEIAERLVITIDTVKLSQSWQPHRVIGVAVTEDHALNVCGGQQKPCGKPWVPPCHLSKVLLIVLTSRDGVQCGQESHSAQ